jgi:hypothetical protein
VLSAISSTTTLAQRRPGRDEVDDQIGEPDQRRELDRPVQRNQFDRQIAVGEERLGRARELRRDAQKRRVRRAFVIPVDPPSRND